MQSSTIPESRSSFVSRLPSRSSSALETHRCISVASRRRFLMDMRCLPPEGFEEYRPFFLSRDAPIPEAACKSLGRRIWDSVGKKVCEGTSDGTVLLDSFLEVAPNEGLKYVPTDDTGCAVPLSAWFLGYLGCGI